MFFKFSTESFLAMSTPRPIDFVEREEANSRHLISSRSQTTTLAPACERAVQWFFPINPIAPVTIATLFFSENSSNEFINKFKSIVALSEVEVWLIIKNCVNLRQAQTDIKLFLLWFHIKVTNFSKYGFNWIPSQISFNIIFFNSFF